VKDVKIEKQEVEESKHRIDEDGGDLTKVPKELELDDTLEEKDKDEDGEHPKLSKRKLKKLSRLSVAELKQLVTRPGKNLNKPICQSTIVPSASSNVSNDFQKTLKMLDHFVS